MSGVTSVERSRAADGMKVVQWVTAPVEYSVTRGHIVAHFVIKWISLKFKIYHYFKIEPKTKESKKNK